MLKNTSELIDALAEKHGDRRLAYAEAFGYAWGSMSEAAKERMLKIYSKELGKENN